MAKINWKVRFKNKAFLITFTTTVIAFLYQLLAMFGIVPAISEDVVTQLVMMIINVLATLGIVVDGTTKGVSDSTRALTYDEPQ